MGQPYVGEIRIFAGSFAPNGWLFCDGALLPISEYEVLFQLIGTTYGGDGQNTFRLPDLRGRVPIHFGQGPGLSNRVVGESGGVPTVTLSTAQLPAHAHEILAASGGTRTTAPAGALPAAGEADLYAGDAADAQQQALLGTGGGQPHANEQPVLGVNFIISLFGIFPSPT
jgi:microcystin-dependent protein